MTYQKLSTEFYDLTEHPGHDEALSFYLTYAAQAKGHILEPMCGTGRFLIPMLQAGFHAEGFDASLFMLEAFKKKYTTVSNKPAPVWQTFVQDFCSDKKYDLIFVPYGSWGLIINQDDSKKGLGAMFKHLAPGGKFVLEIETVASLPQNCGQELYATHTRSDGSRITLQTVTSYNPQTKIFRSACCYKSIEQDNVIATEFEDFQQYLFDFDELENMLKDVGFMNIKKYQDYKKAPALGPQAPIIIYECIK